MIHITCRLTAKNRDQLRNPTLDNRVWASFTFTERRVAVVEYGNVEGDVVGSGDRSYEFVMDFRCTLDEPIYGAYNDNIYQQEALLRNVRRILVRGSMPPCRLRRRKF